jgi:dihydropteroate synthase
VFVYGVINTSPDSLNEDSIVDGAPTAVARAEQLAADGADGFDIGGQGSTELAVDVGTELEWARLAPVLAAVVALGRPVSVDTWRPTVASRALDAGATVLNAADGLASDAMWEVAARAASVVVPFLNGPDPLHLAHVDGDPVDVMVEWFTAIMERAGRVRIADKIVIDPGTGFAPAQWPWAQRFIFQKHVYENLDRLRVFDRPLYIALPWRDTPQHLELLEIVLRQNVEFGRAHYPARVRAVADRLGLT